MWPFGKKSAADKAISVMDDAISASADRWKYFLNTLKFKEGVGLDEMIMMFAVPMTEGLRNNFPELKNSPDEALFLFIVKGVERSGTHSKKEIEQALGLELPEG